MSKETQSPIRVGIVGIGRAGWKQHSEELEARPEKFQVVAGCDIEADRREMIADRFGCVTYENVRDLIDDENVDLVDIVTRSPDHVKHASMALRAGKTVFLEKPIALSYDQARRLKTALDETGSELYVRHNRRFEPAFQHIREIIATGMLGDVYEVKLARHTYQRRDDWQTLLDAGGGQLLNWGPHIIDHGLQFLDSEVVSLWSDLKKIAAVGDAEDHLKVVMQGANGRVVDIEISGGVAIPAPVFIIFGERGTLSCDGSEIHMKYLDPDTPLPTRQAREETPPIFVESGSHFSQDVLHWKEERFKVSPADPVDMTSIWDRLYDSIRHRLPYPITLDQALEVMRIISRVRKGTPFDRPASPKN